MAKKETYFQVGICPHCSDNTRQEFVEGIHEYSEERPDNRGKRYVYGDVHTLSFFRCDNCYAILGYRTYYADAVDIEEAQKLDKKWVLQQDDCESDSCFKTHASLIYSTHKTERELSDHVPDEIKSLYQTALKVKRIEPNSFAVQIGRALQAVCIDQGQPGKNLNADLKELSKRGVLPPTMTEIAHKLRDSRNDGAHVRPQKVESHQVQSIDDFFHLIVNYVYDAPALLRSYREQLEIEVPEIFAGDQIN